jgi:hypothetical protein
MIRPQIHRLTGELGIVVAEKHFRRSPLRAHAAQYAHHVLSLHKLAALTRTRSVHSLPSSTNTRKALLSEIVRAYDANHSPVWFVLQLHFSGMAEQKK